MSDYTKTTNFTAKDQLSTGNALKAIKGSYFDTEFDAIATAVATKYDSNDIASQAQAEALSSNLVLMTPGRLKDVMDDNDAMLTDIQAITGSAADGLLAWDQGTTTVKLFTMGAGLEFSGDTINLKDAVAGAGLTVASSILAVGGGNGITANADDVALTDVAATGDNPFVLSSGTFSEDWTALTTMEGNALAAADLFIVEVSGNKRSIAYQDMGLNVTLGNATQTLALADANTIMEFNGTATVTIPANAAVAFKEGCAIIFCCDHATQEITITADTGVTLNSVNHPGGGSAASDVVLAGGTAALIKTSSDEWYLSGNIGD